MDPSTTKFDELIHHWSSGDHVYKTAFQLDNTTPNTIFYLAFSNDSNKFFSDLINSPTTLYSVSPWNHQPPKSTSEYIDIQQRNLSINPTKNGTTNITQTAFFKADSIIIYSISQLQKQNKKCHYTVICQWIIKTHSKNVHIAIDVSILCNVNKSQILAVLKTKWLTFYQSHFETWKRLVNEHINCQFIGTWNKLNSYKTRKITMDKIEYSDGAKINIKINTKTNEIIAYYSPKQFVGKLVEFIEKNKRYQLIEWNNSATWLKNGFLQFEGKYKSNETEHIYVINKSGLITMPMWQKQIQFQLAKLNQIQYTSNDHIIHKGVLCEYTSNIKWDDASIWIKEESIDSNDVSPSVYTESENEKTDEIDSDFEHIEENGITYREENVCLQIKNNHFALVNEKECETVRDEKLDNNEVDEWLLV